MGTITKEVGTVSFSLKNFFKKRAVQLFYITLRVIKNYIVKIISPVVEKIKIYIKKAGTKAKIYMNKVYKKIADKTATLIDKTVAYIGKWLDKFELWLLKTLGEIEEVLEDVIDEPTIEEDIVE